MSIRRMHNKLDILFQEMLKILGNKYKNEVPERRSAQTEQLSERAVENLCEETAKLCA